MVIRLPAALPRVKPKLSRLVAKLPGPKSAKSADSAYMPAAGVIETGR